MHLKTSERRLTRLVLRRWGWLQLLLPGIMLLQACRLVPVTQEATAYPTAVKVTNSPLPSQAKTSTFTTSPTSTTAFTQTPTSTHTPTSTPLPPPVVFAVIGDYGAGN